MKNVRVSRTNLVLRFAAGIYLLYSAVYLLIRAKSSHISVGFSLYSYIFSGLFAVFGVILLYASARRYGAQQLEESPASPGEMAPPPVPGGTGAENLAIGISSCIIGHRDISHTFNEFDYARGFREYADACRDALLPLDTLAAEQGAGPVIHAVSQRLIFDLKASYASSASEKEKRAFMSADKKTMTFYFIPLINSLGLSISKPLADGVCESWNTAFPSYAFSVGTFEQILGGFSGKSLLRHFGVRK